MAKLLNQFLQPIALLWVALVLYTLWKLGKRQWRLAVCPALVALFLYAIGGSPWPARLLASLEQPYAGVKLSSLPVADAVVMLGGATTPSTNDVFDFHFGPAADRIVSAIEVVRQRKGRVLVLGGGLNPLTVNPGEGELLRGWIEAWDVPRVPIHVLGLCQNTRDEAMRTRALAEAQGWKRIILVTSAAHMRRAEATFRRAGLEVIPFACDFDGLTSLRRPWTFRIVPSIEGFESMELYLHEVVGGWVYRWRGWL